MLGKRSYGSRSKAGRGYKRRKLSGRYGRKPYARLGDGNTRTGGLYRLRGRTIGRGVGRPELKYFEREIETGVTAADTFAVTFLRPMAGGAGPARLSGNNYYQAGSFLGLLKQGTNSNQRIGRKITIKSIDVKGEVQAEQEIQVDLTFCVWLVLDKQANGTQFTAADLLAGPSADANSGQSPVTQINNRPNSICVNYLIANSQRFVVLTKKIVQITNQIPWTENVAGLRGGGKKMVSIHKKVNIPIEFGGPNGDLNEIKSNNIGIIVTPVGNTSADDNTPICAFNGKYMLRFTDV